MKIYRKLFALLFLTISFGSTAEEIREFYTEPGLHPFKSPIESINELIDPFGGTLQLRHTDVSLPGNGGLEIKVTRFYTNPQLPIGWYNGVMGLGWTMHFGRVVVPIDHADKVCNQENYSVHTADNPSIEYADGARELLVLSTDADGALVTKSNWRVTCLQDGTGFLAKAPNGMHYLMDEQASVDGEISWFTTKISAPRGNFIRVSYIGNFGYSYIDKVEGFTSAGEADGRTVQFTYATDASGCKLLDHIEANGQVWTYMFDPAPGFSAGACKFALVSVGMPEGMSWNYDYLGDLGGVTAGDFSLQRVIYPYGGEVNYTYQPVHFDEQSAIKTSAISTKSTSGPGVSPGIWSYTFYPGGSIDVPTADLTVVTGPHGKTEYVHQGYTATGFGNTWAMGLLLSKKLYDASDALVEQETRYWDKRVISYENYWHGRQGLGAELDTETHSPILKEVQTWRAGSSFSVIHSLHDSFGNVGRVIEATNLADEEDRITDFTYYNDIGERWIIGLTEDEVIADGGTIDRTYNAYGEITSEDKYGVTTTSTYTSEGDVETVTDMRHNTVIYANYKRGIAQFETHPESVAISRSVNPTGTIASETNGRGYTTVYAYDDLNRVSAIATPLGNPTTIIWGHDGSFLTRTTVRGALTATERYDGFGRMLERRLVDTATTETIRTLLNYDEEGRTTFTSLPNSSLGDSFEYDVLGRQTKVTHADNSFRTTQYGAGGIEITETDELGNQTYTLYRAYGHPDNDPVALVINSPEGICKVNIYDKLNHLTLQHQGEIDPVDELCYGYSRTYTYTPEYFLATETNPETGLTQYGRDELGNLTSKQVGSSGVTIYTYDALNRLQSIDYPSEAGVDVTFTYDKNNNPKTQSNSVSLHVFNYDENDNVIERTLTVDGMTFTHLYAYDGNDNNSSIAYPSGRLITYTPNAFGRPTEAAPYVTNVGYHPNGCLKQLQYANGQIADITQDDRQRVDTIVIGDVVQLVGLNYDMDGAGNVQKVDDLLNASNNRSFTYDGVHRLKTASGLWGAANYTYDDLGNIKARSISGVSQTFDHHVSQLRTEFKGGDRYEYYYDDYGNLTRKDFWLDGVTPVTVLIHLYDDAGNLRLVSPGIAYDYDARNRLVKAVRPGEATFYIYDDNERLLGEYGFDTFHGKENFYLGSQLIAAAKHNETPTADAGVDQTVEKGQPVTLFGTQSTDADGDIVGYAWAQTGGPAVSLSNALNETATFTSPQVGVDTILTFQLTVTDDVGDTSTDTVNITVLGNRAPVADAGLDRYVVGGNLVQLDGTGSFDHEGSVSYSWIKIEGAYAYLSNADTATPTFTPGAYSYHTYSVFQLTVTDGGGLSSTDTVRIDILSPILDADADGLKDWWEILNFGSADAYDLDDDPDSDGLTNQQEFEQGTDPNMPEPVPEAVIDYRILPGDSEVLISWDAITGTAYYNLYWGLSPITDVALANKLSNVTSSYRHQGLTNGTTYYYAVTAVNNVGESAVVESLDATPGVREWTIPTPQLDMAGQNSSYPVVGSDDHGRRLVVWKEFDGARYKLWSRLFDVRTGWAHAELLLDTDWAIGQLRIAMNSGGDAVLLWLQNDGTRDNLWSMRFYPEKTGWGVAQLVETYNGVANEDGDIDFIDLAINTSGYAVATWNQSEPRYYEPPYNYSGRIGDACYLSTNAKGADWAARYTYDLGDGYVGRVDHCKVDVNSGGEIAVAWERWYDNDGYGGYEYYLSSAFARKMTSGGGWTPIQQIDDYETKFFEDIWRDEISGVDVGIDDAGQVTVAWGQLLAKGQTAYLNYARTYDGDVGQWGDIYQLNNKTSKAPVVETNKKGDTLITWREGYDIKVMYSPAGQGWQSVQILSGASSYLSLDVALNNDGRAFVAWDTTVGSIDVSGYVPSVGWSVGETVASGQNDFGIVVDSSGNAIVASGHQGAAEGDVFVNQYQVPNTVAPENQPPVSNAGVDQTVDEYAVVNLNGSASADFDGVITAYSWVQTGGDVVTLDGSDLVSPSFIAPSVMTSTELTFELTVVDDDGASHSDSVTITVLDRDAQDTIAPTTTSSISTIKEKGDTYFDVVLTVDEPATTYFKVIGNGQVVSGGIDTTDWQVYTGIFRVFKTSKNGSVTLEYYSSDTASNQEAVIMETLN